MKNVDVNQAISDYEQKCNSILSTKLPNYSSELQEATNALMDLIGYDAFSSYDSKKVDELMSGVKWEGVWEGDELYDD